VTTGCRAELGGAVMEFPKLCQLKACSHASSYSVVALVRSEVGTLEKLCSRPLSNDDTVHWSEALCSGPPMWYFFSPHIFQKQEHSYFPLAEDFTSPKSSLTPGISG
jgi:hypothetical protein